MAEQVVELYGEIDFPIKLDEMEFGKVLISPKHNFGHLLWSIKVLKNIPSKENIIQFCVQFERQADGTPAEFELEAHLNTGVVTDPDSAPKRDIQYHAFGELLNYDSSSNSDCDKDRSEKKKDCWQSEWHLVDMDERERPETELCDQEGRVHLWTRVHITGLSKYGRIGKPDQLTVNNKSYKVNKYLLAMHSPFFRTFFFGNGFKECLTQNFHIQDPGVDADQFGKMLNLIMTSDQQELNDANIEGLLHLADKFDVPVVKELCEKFLLNYDSESFEWPPFQKFSKIFKFRMAETYGLVSLKIHALSDPHEFCANFGNNVAEYNKLGERSKRTWDHHMESVAFSYNGEQPAGKRPRLH